MSADDHDRKSSVDGKARDRGDRAHRILLRHVTIPSNDGRYELKVVFSMEDVDCDASAAYHAEVGARAGKLLLKVMNGYKEEARRLTEDRIIEYRWDPQQGRFRCTREV